MKKLLIVSAFVVGAIGVRADESAFQLSLTPDIAIHPRTTEISAFSLNVWGENPQHGVALGFVNYSKESFKGLQWGFVNYTEKLDGVQLGLVNIVTDNGWFDQFPGKLAKGFPFFNWSF